MKKNGILNSEISRVLSYMGHTDWIAIGDCGLPIPDEVERIDLALTFGEPGFMRTLELVAADMTIENVKSELGKILIDGEERTTMLKEYDRMLEILGEAGASERAAGKIVGLLKNRG